MKSLLCGVTPQSQHCLPPHSTALRLCELHQELLSTLQYGAIGAGRQTDRQTKNSQSLALGRHRAKRPEGIWGSHAPQIPDGSPLEIPQIIPQVLPNLLPGTWLPNPCAEPTVCQLQTHVPAKPGPLCAGQRQMPQPLTAQLLPTCSGPPHMLRLLPTYSGSSPSAHTPPHLLSSSSVSLDPPLILFSLF